MKTPTRLMLDDLARSGLTPADAKKMGCEAYADARDVGMRFAVSCYVIPYFRSNGEPYPRDQRAYRVRYTAPLPGSFVKPRKYDQPRGSRPYFYFAPGHDWEEVANDTAREVWFTEGEKKAYAACEAGTPTIGLGGVWNWKSKRLGLSRLPDFDCLGWAKRPVCVAFDSDDEQKPDVKNARNQLAETLMHLGAVPHFVDVPPSKAGDKQGLDDYLVGGGDLTTLDKKIVPGARELWAMNARFAKIERPPMIWDVKNRQQLSRAEFLGLATAGEHYEDAVTGKQRKTGKEWLDSEWSRSRREHAALTIDPGGEEVTADDELNIWLPSGVEPKRPPPGALKPYHDFLDYLMSAESETREALERWAAYPLQNPGAKLHTAVMVWSTVQGVGKSLFGRLVGACYGGHNTQEIDANMLFDHFDAWKLGKQFINVEEIHQAEHRNNIEKLKVLITSPTLNVNDKNKSAIVIRNVINFYLTSNEPDAINIPSGDRRIAVYHVDATTSENSKRVTNGWFKPIWALLDGDGPSWLLWHFLEEVDCSAFEPHAPPMMTDAKREMIVDARTDIEAWMARLVDEGDAASVLSIDETATTREIWETSELADACKIQNPGWHQSTRAIGIAAKKVGLEKRRVGGGGATTLYAILKREKWRGKVHDAWNTYWCEQTGKRHLKSVEGGKKREEKF